MEPNRSNSGRLRQSENFWSYVPDPSRTIVYLLLTVVAFAGAQWVPEFAGQLEQTRIQDRRQEVRDRQLADLERWRRQNPELEQQYEEKLAQDMQREELETETSYQLAQPNPMPMPTASEESQTQALWN